MEAEHHHPIDMAVAAEAFNVSTKTCDLSA